MASLRTGIVFWQEGEGLATRNAEIARHWGHTVTALNHDGPLPPDLDVVFVQGPFGSLVPLARQLLAQPPGRRPGLALLLTEQLPNPALPEWLRQGLGRLRTLLDRLAYRPGDAGRWQPRGPLGRLTRVAHRYRYYGDLYWLRDSGLLSALGVWSQWTADFLQARGFDAIVPERTYNPDWGRMLDLERDVPVLWLGKAATRRRRRMLASLRAALREQGVEMLVVDGVEHPYVFGQARTKLLNRTRVVVNLLRARWDDNSLRFSLAAHNGALLVSEPTLPHNPWFVNGQHLVEVPFSEMARTIAHYLANEDERRRIAGAAYALMTANQNTGRGIVDLIERAVPQPILQAGS